MKNLVKIFTAREKTREIFTGFHVIFTAHETPIIAPQALTSASRENFMKIRDVPLLLGLNPNLLLAHFKRNLE